MSKKRRTYGTGSLWLRGRIWWIRYHERVDGVSVQRYLSSDSDDPNVAKRILAAKVAAAHGRRPTLVDPQKVTYESLRENALAYWREEKKSRSLKKVGNEEQSLDTLPRLDAFFGGWRARDITTSHIRRFRQEGKHDGLTDARLNRYVATLRKMFRQGRD